MSTSKSPGDSTRIDARQVRIAELAFDYDGEPKQFVDRCNLCGAAEFVALADTDRYGYQAHSSGCQCCGLVFLNPRMTLEAYGAFYDGVYRPLVSAYHGRLIDAVTIQYEQSNYAVERGDLLAPILDRFETGTLLDIGGSTGVVAHAFAERFGVRATVLDPAPAEIDEAHTRGLEIVHGFAEAVDFGNRRFDLVTLCQTVDHLLDVQEILRRVRTLVTDGGVFFVDIVDFRSACHRAGSIEGAIKVDHPYYLVEETMVAFLEQAGFSVITADRASDGLHVSYVCRPEEPMPNACSPSGTAERLWRDIRSLRTRSAT